MKLKSLSRDPAESAVVIEAAVERECREAVVLVGNVSSVGYDARAEPPRGAWSRLKAFFNNVESLVQVQIEGTFGDRPVTMTAGLWDALMAPHLCVGCVDFVTTVRGGGPARADLKKGLVGGWKFECTDKAFADRLNDKPVRKALNAAVRHEYKVEGTTLSIAPACSVFPDEGATTLFLRTTLGGRTRMLLGGTHWFGVPQFLRLADAVETALIS